MTTIGTLRLCMMQRHGGQILDHRRGQWPNSHFASLLPADQQSGDAHHHGNEEQAGADAFDHATQRFCGTEKNEEKKLLAREKGGACCVGEVGLTGLGDHRQRQEGVGEEGRGSGDASGDLAPVLVKQLSKRSDAEPADGTGGQNRTEQNRTEENRIDLLFTPRRVQTSANHSPPRQPANELCDFSRAGELRQWAPPGGDLCAPWWRRHPTYIFK